MVRAARVVEHLRLRAESESAVRHSLTALEDAFRTASLPDAGARLLCVRRLQLGRIPPNASPQGVARQIEQRFAAADWRVVHAGDESGNDAQAVWFRDAFEAHEIAALRLAAGRPLDAWFWPLALPGVMAQPSDQRLRATAFAVAATEEAPAALPAWTASLVRAGYRERLIATLRPGDGRVLLRAAGVRQAPFERARPAVASVTDAPVARLTNNPLNDREVFVEAMVGRPSGRSTYDRPIHRARREPAPAVATTGEPLRDETPATAPAADADVQAYRLFETASAPLPRETTQPVVPGKEIELSASPVPQRSGETVGDTLAEVQRAQPTVEAPAPAIVADENIEPLPPQHGAPPDTRQEPDAAAPDGSDGGTGEALLSPWHFPYAAPTSAGGLLLLLPVLEQVGFAKWAAERSPEEPEPEVLAAEILHLLLSRLGVADDDPVWELVGGLRGFRLQAEGSGVAETWLTACRRFLRRRVRIGLANLVVRPARLTMTHTHVDVFFRLNAADLRIRRAGLDIDPGWVPWFKRVVLFHYEDRPWQ